jgi:hypothetical protein
VAKHWPNAENTHGLCGEPLLHSAHSTEVIEELECTDCACRVAAVLHRDLGLCCQKMAIGYAKAQMAMAHLTRRD